jgi:hypothetical protein
MPRRKLRDFRSFSVQCRFRLVRTELRAGARAVRGRLRETSPRSRSRRGAGASKRPFKPPCWARRIGCASTWVRSPRAMLTPTARRCCGCGRRARLAPTTCAKNWGGRRRAIPPPTASHHPDSLRKNKKSAQDVLGPDGTNGGLVVAASEDADQVWPQIVARHPGDALDLHLPPWEVAPVAGSVPPGALGCVAEPRGPHPAPGSSSGRRQRSRRSRPIG